jgi:predicted DNA-binding transcriptional regulator AlpA
MAKEQTTKETVPIAWTFDETAAAIRVTSRHLRGLIAKGKGPKAIRLGRRVLFLPETVQSWLKSREEAAAA